MIEKCEQQQQRPRRTTEHGYTVSSPCEPSGSGELNLGSFFTVKILFAFIIHLRAEKYIKCAQITSKCYICAHVFAPLSGPAADSIYYKIIPH